MLQAGRSAGRGHEQQDLEEGNAGVLPVGDHFFFNAKSSAVKRSRKGARWGRKKKKSDLKLN